MPLIEVEPNKFINMDHVVIVAYKPGVTITEEVVEASDYSLQKSVKSKAKSTIKVTLSSGEKIEKNGQDADALFKSLTGKTANS